MLTFLGTGCRDLAKSKSHSTITVDLKTMTWKKVQLTFIKQQLNFACCNMCKKKVSQACISCSSAVSAPFPPILDTGNKNASLRQI